MTVEGLSRDSLQGDVAFCDCLARMGCQVEYGAERITVAGRPLRGIDVDMNAISDTVQTLAAVALFADGPTTIRNVAHIRHKETDRICGPGHRAAQARRGGRGARRRPADHARGRCTARDDRHLRRPPHGDEPGAGRPGAPGVVIRNPGCTAKTYPGFFDDLAGLTREP